MTEALHESRRNNPIIQLVRYGALGDLLMTTAAFPGLKARGYRIRYVCHQDCAPILENNPFLDELVTVPQPSLEAVNEAVRHLEPPARIAYPNYPDEFVSPRRHPIPMSLPHYFCQSLDVPLSDELHLGLTEAQLAWGQQFQDAVLIHTTAKWSPYKDWPVDRWAAVARHLAEEDGLRVLQLGGPYDKPIPGVAKIDSPGLLYAAGAIAWCRLFMGVDSVFNHISRALKKPSLILWGSTHPQGTGYRQNINLINGMVWRPEMGNDGPVLKCQPCYREYAHLSPLPQSACPYTQPYLHRVLPEDLHPGEPSIHTCMANNTVPVVLHHARHLLRQGPGQ